MMFLAVDSHRIGRQLFLVGEWRCSLGTSIDRVTCQPAVLTRSSRR